MKFEDQSSLFSDFRIYYNHTIYPELLRLERRRERLLRLILFSVFLLIAISIFALYLGIFSFILLLLVPIGFYATFLGYRIQQFRISFKPKVVNLILDFIDDLDYIQELDYDALGFIPKSRFLESKIFITPAPEYSGEELITGKIRELPFEMCELNIREFSPVRSRLNYVFRGIFLIAESKKTIWGTTLILPKAFKKYLSNTIQNALANKAVLVEKLHDNEEFDEHFITYASPNARISHLLSPELQDTLLKYRTIRQKELYVSFIEGKIYVAITEPRDMLEPYIFASNLSFELIREFFEDILLMINFVEDFDATH